MKHPTAPIYPELPIEDGQHYRLQKNIRDRKAINTREGCKKGFIQKV